MIPKLKKALLITIFLSVSAIALAQVPKYRVQPTTKKYTIFHNPLIKKTKQVEVLVINGEAYLEGDISLGKTSLLDQIQRTMQGMQTQSVIADDNVITARWENGIIPFTITNDFSGQERQIIQRAMDHIAEKTNVCFKDRGKEGNFIKFKKYTVDELGFEGGSSYLGKCSFCVDGQEIRLSTVDIGLVCHEIGHAIGLMHEQCREDRNSSVEIITDNIEPKHLNQFDQSIYTTTDVGNYDFSSIMHYPFNAFGKVIDGVTQQTIKRRVNSFNTSFGSSVLSAGDIRGINTMYPNEQKCSGVTTTEPQKLARGELAVGESKTFSISAKEIHNATGIFMRMGQKFQFSTSSPDWKNGDKSTDCDGYDGNILDAARRHGDIKMMALVGEIFTENNTASYTGTYFKIGCSKTWTSTKTGFLICIANDNVIAYGDNLGSVSLTIKRVL